MSNEEILRKIVMGAYTEEQLKERLESLSVEERLKLFSVIKESPHYQELQSQHHRETQMQREVFRSGIPLDFRVLWRWLKKLFGKA